MFSYKKSSIDKYLDPLIIPLKRVSPNVLTILGIIPSILFFIFVINKLFLLALIVLIGAAFDMIDGMVARKYNKVTKFGGFLDSTFDRISDFLIIFAFGFAGITRWEIVAPLIFFSILTSYTRARGESANTGISFAVGLIERTERLVLIAIALIVYMIFPSLYVAGFGTAEIILLILLVLSLFTSTQRIYHAYKHL